MPRPYWSRNCTSQTDWFRVQAAIMLWLTTVKGSLEGETISQAILRRRERNQCPE